MDNETIKHRLEILASGGTSPAKASSPPLPDALPSLSIIQSN
jgi:hypothetical protein